MLSEFYGRVLVPPTEVEHTQACFTSMIRGLRTALEQAGIRDQIVVIRSRSSRGGKSSESLATQTVSLSNLTVIGRARLKGIMIDRLGARKRRTSVPW
jgi:hypothetical protein